MSDIYQSDADTGATLEQAGRGEQRRDYARVDSSNAPSDFVGFSEFAGLNDDMMREIADRAAGDAEKTRAGAAGYLKAAEKETNATTPMEKTASYGKYLEAMAKASGEAEGGIARTNNPYEDALRQIYAPAQQTRDNRQAGNAMRVAGAKASQRDAFIAKQADWAAKLAEQQKVDEALAKEQQQFRREQEIRDLREAAFNRSRGVSKEKARDTTAAMPGLYNQPR